jgi:hypothetical protein
MGYPSISTQQYFCWVERFCTQQLVLLGTEIAYPSNYYAPATQKITTGVGYEKGEKAQSVG